MSCIHSWSVYFEKLNFIISLSLLLPGAQSTRKRHVAALSLLRLTDDKGFNAHQKIQPAWQFLILTDSNSEQGKKKKKFLPPQLPKWQEGRQSFRGELNSCNFLPLLIKLISMSCWSLYFKWRYSVTARLFITYIPELSTLSALLPLSVNKVNKVYKVAKWILRTITLQQQSLQ